MKREEMFDILVEINEYYSNFEATEKKAIAWQNVLYFVKAEDLRYALIKYVRNELFPPTIAGLLEYWKGNSFEKSKDKMGD